MPKKQRRVSFNLPEKKPEEEEQEDHGFTTSINDGSIDEDVETIEDARIGDRQSDAEESDSSESSTSDEENKAQRVNKRKRKRRREKVAKKRTNKPESDDEIRPSKQERQTKDMESQNSEALESESGTDSNEDSDAGSDADPADHSDIGSDADTDQKVSKGTKEGSGSDLSDSSSEEDSDEEDSESEAPTAAEKGGKAPTPISTFSEMGLDARVERAVERMGWRKPTPVQSAVIPAAMAGRDVLVSAPTGSGKTASYAVPIVQQLCRNSMSSSGIRCVILVPTRELVHQVTKIMKQMCKYVEGIHVGSAAGKDAKKGKRGDLLSQTSDILVATPSALVAATSKEEKNSLGNVEFVVVDEADLVLNYGYEDEARAVLSRIPNTAQSVLVSATLEADGMDAFRKVILRHPLTIKVTADDSNLDADHTGATHYYARLKNHKDRYLVTYAMLRLNVICGKVLIFVNNINTAFRLKLFLDQFKLKSAVLNSELPVNSRIHCVEQFNAGVFEILIATDESKQEISGSGKGETRSRNKGKKRKRIERDEEFGLSRGVDFKDVAAVFNFDIPEDFSKYTHRAGRTARAGKTGTVLTPVCQDKEEINVLDMGRKIGIHIGPIAFRMDQIEALRYRVESSLRLVTDTAVHGARLADVRREIVNSEALKDYFEDNPHDLDALQHNMNLAKKIPEHLGHIPSYLLPPALRGSANNELKGKRFKRKRHKHSGSRGNTDQRKRADPLKSFSTSGVSGSSRHRYRTKHGIKTKKKDLGRALKKRRRTY